VLLFPLLVAIAHAGRPAGYYHPDDVATKSRLFGQVAAAMGPAFESCQTDITRATAALASAELALGLLGSSAPKELSDWYGAARRDLTGQALRVQRHADALTEESSRAFGDALARALPAAQATHDLKTCGATGVAAMMGRTTCTGEDLNARLAAAMDADAALGKAIEPLVRSTWPSIALPSTAIPAAPWLGSSGWVDGARVAETLVGARITAARAAATQAAEVAQEQGDTAAMKAARTRWLDALAADGGTLRSEVGAALTRAAKKAPALGAVGWCTNPRALGGCTGEDRTAEVLTALEADAKLRKALAKALPAPEGEGE
jgi:hypothetical protein